MITDRSVLIWPTLFLAFSISFINSSSRAQVSSKLFIRINQLGYRPEDPKIALAFASEPLPQKFAVVDSATKQVVFAGSPVPVKGRWGQFEYHADLDFTSLVRSGKYFVQVGDAHSNLF